jgi:hypothetical protein
MSTIDKNENIAREIMADSKLDMTDPGFDEIVMGKIMFESEKMKRRKYYLSGLILFIGIEFTLLAFLMVILYYFHGNIFLKDFINDNMQYFTGVGQFVLHYDYIILSFVIVGILDLILNKRSRVVTEGFPGSIRIQ